MFVESVRSRAFKHFDAGLRPSQLPDLGVPRETLYRYFQAWKKLNQDESWIWKTIPMTRRKVEHRKVNDTPRWLLERMIRQGRSIESATYIGSMYRKIPSLRRGLEKGRKEAVQRGQELARDATWPTALSAWEIDDWFHLAEMIKAKDKMLDAIIVLEELFGVRLDKRSKRKVAPRPQPEPNQSNKTGLDPR